MIARSLALIALVGCRPFLPDYTPPVETDDSDVVDTDTSVIDTDTDTDTGIVDTGVETDEEVVLPYWEHDQAAPWGLHFLILEVAGGTASNGNLQIGDLPTITFVVVDDEGVPFRPDEITDLDFGMSGPAEHMAIVYYPESVDVDPLAIQPVYWFGDDRAPDNIAWEFTFPTPIPATYARPPNDTNDIGLDVGDYGGEPVVDGTYLVSTSGFIRHQMLEEVITDANSASRWIQLGENPGDFYDRERVLTENCSRCHGEDLVAHNNTQVGTVNDCLVCHVMGAEDYYSKEDPFSTPGNSLFLPVMIHRLHSGGYLTKPFIVTEPPSTDEFPFDLEDWSFVRYPTWPGGVAGCSCHDNARQGYVQNTPTREACGACHDAVVWSTGEGHGDGGPALDDLSCTNSGCHPPTDTGIAHRDVRKDPAQNLGIVLDIIRGTGGTGPQGQFLPGDKLTIEYTAKRSDGSRLDVKDPLVFASGQVRLAGPLEHMQRVVSSSDLVANSTEDIVNQTWTYRGTAAIPTTVPAQMNNTTTLGLADGDWFGLPLVSGTYRIAISGNTIVVDDTVNRAVPAADTTEVLVGDATVLGSRDIVTNALCEDCHDRIWWHADTRTNVKNCVTCHTPGAEDRYSATDPTTTPGRSVDFPDVIHKLHSGRALSEPYTVNGFGTPYGVRDFTKSAYPRFDGGAAACETCHLPGTYQASTKRACFTCHDSAATASHIAVNTDATGVESCDVCHGPTRSASVEATHHEAVERR